jgi:hypothetical protein
MTIKTLPQPGLSALGLFWIVQNVGGGPLGAFPAASCAAHFVASLPPRHRVAIGHTVYGWADMSPHEELGMDAGKLADWLTAWSWDHERSRETA